jgi:ribosome-associated protein
VGKLMRKLNEQAVVAMRDALNEQRMGSTRDTLALHLAEHWRDRLIQDDNAVSEWMLAHPGTDSQQLRALVRQARKDDTTSKADVAKGLLPRQGRAYRDIFQLVKTSLIEAEDAARTPEENDSEMYKP